MNSENRNKIDWLGVAEEVSFGGIFVAVVMLGTLLALLAL